MQCAQRVRPAWRHRTSWFVKGRMTDVAVDIRRGSPIDRNLGRIRAQDVQRGRLWLANGSCIRLRPEHLNHVVLRLRRGPHPRWRNYRMLNVLDEFTHECLAISVSPTSSRQSMSATFCLTCSSCGVPGHIRSDNGPEFMAKLCRNGS
jgi:putative transposase